MRISDWSSDVCSSDLWCRRPRRSVSRVPSAHIQYEHVYPPGTDAADLLVQMQLPFVVLRQVPRDVETEASPLADGLGCHERREHTLGAVFGNEIGRESCRERVCQYVCITVVAVSLKTKIHNYKLYRD